MSSTFGARDLALLLPDKVAGDAHSLRHIIEEKGEQHELLQPKVDQSKKVVRYFPGKAPTWAGVAQGGAESGTADEEYVAVAVDRTTGRDFKSETVEDSRLARLARATSSSSSSAPVEEGRPRRRRYEAEVIIEAPESEATDDHVPGDVDPLQALSRRADTGDEDDEDVAERRARIQRRLAMQKEQAERSTIAIPVPEKEYIASSRDKLIGKEDEEEEEEEESESEYETDSEEEEEDERVMLRPVFVPKAKRETIKEKEAREAEEALKEEKKLFEKEERKRQTREMVADSIRRNEELKDATDADSDAGLPDDTDDPDDELEVRVARIRNTLKL
jgi:microfibrillar-associated protein 1